MPPASTISFFLGIWLVFSAMAAAAPPAARAAQLASGIVVAALAAADLARPRGWTRWGLVFSGVWLLFEPLVFWAPAAMFGTDQLSGTLLIVLAGVRADHLTAPSERPPDWSYNPSTWSNRLPIVGLAFAGFFAARAMAAYQLGHVKSIWDPFFGEGTVTVLTSKVAEAFPISDAGLGAVAYLLEGLSGVVGDERRWRTMPWMVFLFFVLVVPAGVVSIVLVMLQPVAVGAWCTLCLFTAFVTLISIPPAVDEVFASAQHLMRVRRSRGRFWKAFWGVAHTGPEGEPSGKEEGGLLSGIRMPPPLLGATLGGVVLLCFPGLFGLEGNTANNDFVTGALVITFGVLASAEPSRSARLVNIPIAAWIVASPVVFEGTGASGAAHVALGLAIAGLSVPRGPVRERYGGWERYII